MHDISLAQPLCREIEAIAKKHSAQRVLRVLLEVGPDFQMSTEHFKETFLMLAEESVILRNTRVEFLQTETVNGHEMILRDVELEVP